MDLLAVRVLDRGVVLVDKVVLDKLDADGRFADATAAKNDQLVLDAGAWCAADELKDRLLRTLSK